MPPAPTHSQVKLPLNAFQIPDLSSIEEPRGEWFQRRLCDFGTALDSAVLRATQVAVDAMVMPRPDRLPELRASAEPLLDSQLLSEPWRFFAFEEAPEALEATVERRRSMAGGRVVRRTLTTGYQTYGANGNGGANGGPNGKADRILLEHWMHRADPPRGTLVAVHGYRMGRPRIDAVQLMAREWFRRGLDVALVTLPHHGARTPEGARFSGEAFAVPHVARLAEAVRQAVYELRLLALWLREREAGPVGFLGQSLGGYLVALLAGLYDDLDFVIPMVPPACMGDLAWRFLRRSRHYRDGLPPEFSRQEMRVAFRIHSPLAHPLRAPRESVLLVAGLGDRIVPPEHAGALWRHWGEPAIHWFHGGHIARFGRAGIIDAVEDHLERIGIL
jgi:hypothetical protein